jgi:hypothetical protein
MVTVSLTVEIRDAPDTNLSGFPAYRISGYPKAGYRLSGEAGYQISSRIFCSKFKWLLKYRITKKPDVRQVSFFKSLPKNLSSLQRINILKYRTC